jgi:hypothetical protein
MDALSSDKEITGFSFAEPPAEGTITGLNITVTVPFSTDRTSLTPTITHTGESVSPASGAAQNFTGPVKYTVTAKDGSTAVYTVTVSLVQAPGAKEITGFSFESPKAAGSITGTNITVTVPFDTDLTSLIPTITHTGKSVSPASGEAQNFTGPVEYTVTAKDGSTAVYTVTVRESSAAAREITGFSFESPPAEGTITGLNIAVTVPFSTDRASLIPIIIFEGKSVSPASGEAQNFTGPVEYTVTSANNETAVYTVTVSLAQASGAKEITGFSFESPKAAGSITGTDITVTVPFDTDLTSLIPTITHTGKSVSPVSGAAQNFTGSVEYTVTAENNETAVYTVTVSEEGIVDGAGIANLEKQLAGAGGDSAEAPLAVTVSLELNRANWNAILAALNASGKYAALNLSACTGVEEFNPGEADTGEKYIVSLVLPSGAGSISPGQSRFQRAAFRYFTNLKAVSGAGIQIVGAYAFAGCTALESVSFPEATNIDGYTFYGCTALESVDLPEAKTFGDCTFYGCTALTSISLPKAETFNIHNFHDCTALESVDLPEATNIGDCTFYDCTALKSIYFPKAETPFATMFAGCTALESVSLPKVKTFYGRNFDGCTSLTSINLPEAETFDYSEFEGCIALESINLPKAETFGYNAFAGCTALESVDLPKAETFGSRAFKGCTALESINILNVKSIGNNAFEGCIALKTLYFPASPPSMGSSVFKDTWGGNMSDLTMTIHVPADALDIYKKWELIAGSNSKMAIFTDES